MDSTARESDRHVVPGGGVLIAIALSSLAWAGVLLLLN